MDLPDSGRAEVGDTIRPRAHALNGLGDSIQATIFWNSLDTATLAVLDSTTGVALAKQAGVGRLEARTGPLRSDPQPVTVFAFIDSIAAGGPTRDTVFVTPVPPDTMADSLSDTLAVQAFATGVIPAGRRVVYAATTFPASGSVVTFVPNDTVQTNLNGLAIAQLRLLPGSVPDSVLVTASAQHINGAPVTGSPVTFVVVFHP